MINLCNISFLHYFYLLLCTSCVLVFTEDQELYRVQYVLGVVVVLCTVTRGRATSSIWWTLGYLVMGPPHIYCLCRIFRTNLLLMLFTHTTIFQS